MTDGNISMEEDTELRDLVVQTLENNGVLAKIRAELRASVFLALEEQESVMNPEPLLNKTVKQYLSNSEGKLLFSLVREFLEYFGLEYTISVYDPETYLGKEYSYIGRNKLCEELGITSTEPLLGEILKSSINSALNSTQKDTLSNKKHDETLETKIADRTYDLSVPKIIHDQSVSSLNDTDVRDNAESTWQQSSETVVTTGISKQERSDGVPCVERTAVSPQGDSSDSKAVTNEKDAPSARREVTDEDMPAVRELSKANHLDSSALCNPDVADECDESTRSEVFSNRNEIVSRQNNINNLESRMANNVQNKRQNNHGSGKTVYFEEIIVDGRKESINAVRVSESYLTDVTDSLDKKISGSIFNDLPPLNGKKAIEKHDLRELMDIGLATDDAENYEEDFASSASVSTNERSPSRDVIEKLSTSPQRKPAGSHRIAQHDRDGNASVGLDEADDTADEASCAEIIGTDKESTLTAGITVKYANCV